MQREGAHVVWDVCLPLVLHRRRKTICQGQGQPWSRSDDQHGCPLTHCVSMSDVAGVDGHAVIYLFLLDNGEAEDTR